MSIVGDLINNPAQVEGEYLIVVGLCNACCMIM